MFLGSPFLGAPFLGERREAPAAGVTVFRTSRLVVVKHERIMLVRHEHRILVVMRND